MSQKNPLAQLGALGHSVWYDFIRRDLPRTGELARWIATDDLRGMTSNPTIFQKAIAGSDLYDEDIGRLTRQGKSPRRVFEELAVTDVQACADLFRPVWERTGGTDGFVSIEVGPELAHDAAATLLEAQRLHAACARANVMVKIPGTKEGLVAIRKALAQGISINVTLLFSVERYREVMEAYLSGMEDLLAQGRQPQAVRSVASFFVSRVDTKIDQKLDRIAQDKNTNGIDRARAQVLRGHTAVANARAAYRAFEEVFSSARFQRLAARGVAVQRPLWASTSAKDPAYDPLVYVESLVAQNSVNTMPPETYEAYRKAGKPKLRIGEDARELERLLPELQALGIDLAQVCTELEREGIDKFAESFVSLLTSVETKARSMSLRATS